MVGFRSFLARLSVKMPDDILTYSWSGKGARYFYRGIPKYIYNKRESDPESGGVDIVTDHNCRKGEAR